MCSSAFYVEDLILPSIPNKIYFKFSEKLSVWTKTKQIYNDTFIINNNNIPYLENLF